MVDFSTVVEGLLPNIPDEVIQNMKKLGFMFMGPAPHHMNKYADQWFHLECSNDDYKKTGVLGYAVHIIEKDYAEDGLTHLINTRDYII